MTSFTEDFRPGTAAPGAGTGQDAAECPRAPAAAPDGPPNPRCAVRGPVPVNMPGTAAPSPAAPAPGGGAALSAAGGVPEPASAPPAVTEGSGPPGAGAKRPVPAPGAARVHPLAAVMSEDRGPDSLMAHVRKLAGDLGLLWYHTHDSRRSPGGFPDLVITGKRTIFRELKRQDGRVSQAQEKWIAALEAAGDDAAVWRPGDLLSGRIARELAAITQTAVTGPAPGGEP